MKKIKCLKCDLYFKPRGDDQDTQYEAQCCFNCAFILKVMRLTIESLGYSAWCWSTKPLNRNVVLNMDDVKIRRKNITNK